MSEVNTILSSVPSVIGAVPPKLSKNKINPVELPIIPV